MITFLLGTGARVGEATALRWKDVDFENEEVHITATFTKTVGENGTVQFKLGKVKSQAGFRTIPMLREVKAMLQAEHRIALMKNGRADIEEHHVFLTQNGKPIRPPSVSSRLLEFCDRYNEQERRLAEQEERSPVYLPRITAHILRHTFCTRLCEQGVNIKVVQELMGHSSISVTMDIYNEATKEAKKSSIAAVEDYHTTKFAKSSGIRYNTILEFGERMVPMAARLRSRARAERAAYLYACAMVTVLSLFLPYGGYERMMEGKYICFLVLTLGYLAAVAFTAPLDKPRMTAADWCASAYLACSALSALCSPYGLSTLLGGTRRDGLVTLALYAVLYFCLSRDLRADRRLLYLAAAAAALSAALSLAQLRGGNPLGLYPAGMNYYDGDAAYAGFYAGASGNIDFTAFLLSLTACLCAFALARLRLWVLAPFLALALFTLRRLGVASSAAGLAFAAVWGLALLFPRHKKAALLCSAALTAVALALIWRYDGGNRTLTEASRLLHGGFDGSFGSGRLSIWRDCLALVRERPLLGGGPDTLWLRGIEPFTWYRDGVAIPSDVTAAHNEYLNILVNQGALALAAYLGLLGCALARCFRRAEEPRFAICGAGLLCYAAMALFSVSTCITAPYVWMLLALVQKDEFPVEKSHNL